jgi:hypothetical protein
MNEAVQPVDSRHQARERHEEFLNGNLPKDMQLLFDLDHL